MFINSLFFLKFKDYYNLLIFTLILQSSLSACNSSKLLYDISWTCLGTHILKMISKQFKIDMNRTHLYNGTYELQLIVAPNISLYVIFWIVFMVSKFSFKNKTYNPFLKVTLDRAMYSYPYLKTCLGRYKPSSFKDYSWLLLIVITKQTANGNYFLSTLDGHLLSLLVITILGIQTRSPIWAPEIILAYTNHSSK